MVILIILHFYYILQYKYVGLNQRFPPLIDKIQTKDIRSYYFWNLN